MGFRVRVGRRGRRSATSSPRARWSSRLADLHALFEDDEVAGILCARGGAGAGWLLPHARHDAACASTSSRSSATATSPSSISCFNRLERVSFHGPMVAWELAQGAVDEASWKAALEGGARALRDVARRHRRAAGRGGGGPAARRLPVHPGRGRRHALGAEAGRGGHDPLPGGRRREAVQGGPDVATAPAVGRFRGRAGGRVRRHEGLQPAGLGRLHAGGRHPRVVVGPGHAGRARPLQRPRQRSQRHVAAGVRARLAATATRHGSRSWRLRSSGTASDRRGYRPEHFPSPYVGE